MTEQVADVSTMMVEVRGSGNKLMTAYQALPDGSDSHPGVIVIHEIFGLNDNIREITKRLAEQGYASLAVDLFSTGNRVACLLRIFYGMMIRPLHNGTVDELRSAIEFLRSRPVVDPARIGVIGFCMGGTFALQLACKDEELRVASIFYGQNPRPLESVARACPVIGSYPEKDFTAKAARNLEEAL